MIEPEEFVERLCRLGADRGPRRFPRKYRDREILMKSILMLLRSDETYSEAQINAALQEWNRDVAPAIDTDHVTLRRLLIDYGHLERTADGRAYRVGFPPRPLAFDLEVDDIDVRATIAAYLDYAARERQRRRRTASGRLMPESSHSPTAFRFPQMESRRTSSRGDPPASSSDRGRREAGLAKDSI